MRTQAAMQRMDDRVFNRFGEDATIEHVAGGLTECRMIIDHDMTGLDSGFDGVKQAIVPSVLGSFRPGDAVNLEEGDTVKYIDGNHGVEVAYLVGVLYPMRDNIVTVGLHEVEVS